MTAEQSAMDLAELIRNACEAKGYDLRLRAQAGAGELRLVPIQPTPDMLVAGRNADEDCDMPGQVYRAMIAAFPPAQAGADAVREALEQIKAVCTDNDGDDCGHRLALRFVANVAARALATPPSVPGVEQIARVIQQQTCPDDPFDELDDEGRECHRKVARAVLATPPAVPVEREKIARALYEIQPLDDRLDENGDPIPWDGLASFCKELHYKQADAINTSAAGPKS
jgi:hypothetical protein